MKKIMIVDDNYLSAEGIEKNIDWETLNAEIIHVCYNGTSAIEAMKKEPADLIISDIEMPDLDGISMSRQALEINPMLPVLPARSRESYAGLWKSLLRLLSKYPYLRIASLRAALAYGSFFALWSCLAFRMKQEPFFASDDIIGALGLCGLAGASTVVFISGYIQKYGARFFSIVGGCVILLAWLLAFWGNNSYLWMIIAILLIDAGMQSIHLSNQTSVVALDA